MTTDTSPEAVERLAKRMEQARLQCDPECWGRCKECPDDRNAEAVSMLRALSARLGEVDLIATDHVLLKDHYAELLRDVDVLRTQRDEAVALLRKVNERGSCATDAKDCRYGSGPLCEMHDFTMDDEVAEIRGFLAAYDVKETR